jgi:hypothetical protein
MSESIEFWNDRIARVIDRQFNWYSLKCLGQVVPNYGNLNIACRLHISAFLMVWVPMPLSI